jgi:RNA polymerase sigma factor (sigma-70 family)
MSRSLDEIWRDVLGGDQRAWEEIVRLYASTLYALALRWGLSRPDAEDCVQFTWMSLYKHRHSIRDPVKLPYWLFRTAKRQAQYLSRRIGRGRKLRQVPGSESDPITPVEEILSIERELIFKTAMRRLDRRCRELITGLFFAEKPNSYQALARRLGIASNTVGPLRSRCLKRLKEILEDMGYFSD